MVYAISVAPSTFSLLSGGAASAEWREMQEKEKKKSEMW